MDRNQELWRKRLEIKAKEKQSFLSKFRIDYTIRPVDIILTISAIAALLGATSQLRALALSTQRVAEVQELEARLESNRVENQDEMLALRVQINEINSKASQNLLQEASQSRSGVTNLANSVMAIGFILEETSIVEDEVNQEILMNLIQLNLALAEFSNFEQTRQFEIDDVSKASQTRRDSLFNSDSPLEKYIADVKLEIERYEEELENINTKYRSQIDSSLQRFQLWQKRFGDAIAAKNKQLSSSNDSN